MHTMGGEIYWLGKCRCTGSGRKNYSLWDGGRVIAYCLSVDGGGRWLYNRWCWCCHTDVGRRAKIIAAVCLTPITARIYIIDNLTITGWHAGCGCGRSTELITHNVTVDAYMDSGFRSQLTDSWSGSVVLTMDTDVASMEVNCR